MIYWLSAFNFLAVGTSWLLYRTANKLHDATVELFDACTNTAASVHETSTRLYEQNEHLLAAMRVIGKTRDVRSN